MQRPPSPSPYSSHGAAAGAPGDRAAPPVAHGGGAFGRLARATGIVVTGWALAGGAALALLAFATSVSALSNVLFDRPFAADVELTKLVVAVAIFAFLPYCQLVGANVTVDIFTERAGPRSKAVMAALAALVALVFAVVLTRQMALGLDGYRRYREVTPTLGIPLWTAFPPILVSLVLLVAAAAVTLVDAVREATGRPPLLPRRSDDRA